MKGIHPIGVVVRKTGLSDHVIRAWERRYGAIAPNRSDGNQRLYSDEDITRLTLLSKAVGNGSSIGRIANLPIAELRELVGVKEEEVALLFKPRGIEGDVDQAVSQALEFVDESNGNALQKVLSAWMVKYGISPVIERIIPRLMHKIGDLWQDGHFRIHQEHMATEVVRGFLSGALDRVNFTEGARVVITATPPGDMHDIGALLCALAAVSEGFEVLHLGPNVPFPEIIHLAHQRNAAVIMLSIVFSAPDNRLVQGIRSLQELTPPETRLLIGGRSSNWYGEQLTENGIEMVTSIGTLRERLRERYEYGEYES